MLGGEADPLPWQPHAVPAPGLPSAFPVPALAHFARAKGFMLWELPRREEGSVSVLTKYCCGGGDMAGPSAFSCDTTPHNTTHRAETRMSLPPGPPHSRQRGANLESQGTGQGTKWGVPTRQGLAEATLWVCQNERACARRCHVAVPLLTLVSSPMVTTQSPTQVVTAQLHTPMAMAQPGKSKGHAGHATARPMARCPGGRRHLEAWWWWGGVVRSRVALRDPFSGRGEGGEGPSSGQAALARALPSRRGLPLQNPFLLGHKPWLLSDSLSTTWGPKGNSVRSCGWSRGGGGGGLEQPLSLFAARTCQGERGVHEVGPRCACCGLRNDLE